MPNELEELLAKRLSIKGEYPDDVVSPEGNRVPRPPIFRKPTQVVGTELARLLEKLYKVAPEIKGRASLVTPAYTSSRIKGLLNQASMTGDPDSVVAAYNARELLSRPTASSIAGMMSPIPREIYVNTSFDEAENMDTLAHEYQHLMGYRGMGLKGKINKDGSEEVADETGKLAGKLFYPPTPTKRKK